MTRSFGPGLAGSNSEPEPGGSARVTVDLPGGQAYDVTVGPRLLTAVADLVPPAPHARRAAVISNPVVGGIYGARVCSALERSGLQVHAITVADGEEAKSLRTLEEVYRRFAAIPLGRDDLVVALGGGVITDLGGFAAATWHRGVAVVHIATTLLGQVDAAVGGKTGVNLPEGKNLVGAFHQPRAVVADIATLATLPAPELRSGLGEVAKYGFIADPTVLSLLEERPEAALAGDEGLLTEVVLRGVGVKARIVASDEREAGERALLNYGHTLGHAIEVLTGYGTYRHGEAVALGMVFAARLGERLGYSEPGLADRTVALLKPLGLPTNLAGGGASLASADVLPALLRDKKARGGVRFVLCAKPGQAFLSDPVEPGLITEVLATLR